VFVAEVKDSGVQAELEALAKRTSYMQPVLNAVGEDIMARAKERFASGIGPDGQKWAPNARSTLEAFIEKRGGFGEKGINVKGQALAMSKRPLIGHARSLSSQFHVNATNDSVTVSNTMIYAAMQQFGGSKSEFPNLWGDIPARPFLPVKQNGELYPDDQAKIIDTLNSYLASK